MRKEWLESWVVGWERFAFYMDDHLECYVLQLVV